MANLTLRLEDLCGESANDLSGKVLEAPTVRARFSLLERYLESLVIAKGRCGNPAVRHAVCELRSSRGVRVADLISRMGIGQRRFIELFRREVGLTPKLYQRVARFQRVLASIERNSDVSWSDIALLHGYFDQAHLIHDFNTFAGVPPTTYLDRRASRNHVRLPEPREGEFLQSPVRPLRHDTPV